MVWHTTIGSGPTKVMVIHGWFWDHRVFAPTFDCLDADGFTYAFIDIRGYGNSRNLSGKYSIGEVAADAIALADQLGWRDFHVVGHSMGGKAAQKVAMDAGARIRSVVAVTPVPASALPFDDAVFGFFTAACEQDEVALALMGDSVGNRVSKRWLELMLRRARDTAMLEAFKNYMRSFIKDDFSADAHKVKARCSCCSANSTMASAKTWCGASIQNSIRMRKSRRSVIPGTIRCRKHRSILPTGCRPSFNRHRIPASCAARRSQPPRLCAGLQPLHY
jgi:pimeloyl-ACP methyl ester carboxylesterase